MSWKVAQALLLSLYIKKKWAAKQTETILVREKKMPYVYNWVDKLQNIYCGYFSGLALWIILIFFFCLPEISKFPTLNMCFFHNEKKIKNLKYLLAKSDTSYYACDCERASISFSKLPYFSSSLNFMLRALSFLSVH